MSIKGFNQLTFIYTHTQTNITRILINLQNRQVPTNIYVPVMLSIAYITHLKMTQKRKYKDSWQIADGLGRRSEEELEVTDWRAARCLPLRRPSSLPSARVPAATRRHPARCRMSPRCLWGGPLLEMGRVLVECVWNFKTFQKGAHYVGMAFLAPKMQPE